jgi:hypothetical protein
MTVILRDHAGPFDINSVTVLNPSEHCLRVTPGGWAIFFIWYFMDEIFYHLEAESTHVLLRTKHKNKRDKR